MLASALFLSLLASPPHPQTTERAGLTWEEAMAQVEAIPSVVAARRAAQVKREQDRSITGLGNPDVGLSAGGRFGDNSNEGFDGELSVTQPFPLAPVGRDRRKAAEAETNVLEEEANLLVLEAKLHVAEAYFLLHAGGSRLEQMARRVELAEEILANLERGREAGAFTSQDVAAAEAYVAETKLSRLEVEGEVFDLGVQLASRLAHQRPVALHAIGPLPQVPLPPRQAWEAAYHRIDRLPMVTVHRLGKEAAKAQLRERETEGRAFWMGLGGTVLQEGPEDYAVLGTLTLTLPLFDRAARERGALAAASRTRAGEHEQALADARAGLASLIHEVDHTGEVARLTAEVLLPATEESARLAELAFSAGQVTLLEYLHAQDAVSQAAARARRAEAEHAFARAQLALTLEAIGRAD